MAAHGTEDYYCCCKPDRSLVLEFHKTKLHFFFFAFVFGNFHELDQEERQSKEIQKCGDDPVCCLHVCVVTC
jgi:hypothetical protein